MNCRNIGGGWVRYHDKTGNPDWSYFYEDDKQNDPGMAIEYARNASIILSYSSDYKYKSDGIYKDILMDLQQISEEVVEVQWPSIASMATELDERGEIDNPGEYFSVVDEDRIIKVCFGWAERYDIPEYFKRYLKSVTET